MKIVFIVTELSARYTWPFNGIGRRYRRISPYIFHYSSNYMLKFKGPKFKCNTVRVIFKKSCTFESRFRVKTLQYSTSYRFIVFRIKTKRLWASSMVHSLFFDTSTTVIRVTVSVPRKMTKNCRPFIFSRRVFRPRLRCDSYILLTFVTLNRAMNNNNNTNNETRVSVDDVSGKNEKNRVNNVVNSLKQSTRRQSSSAVAGAFRSSKHARTC